MAENLKAAGFKVDMQVVDWSTLIQRRNDPALWDIYITHSAVLPEPTLTPPQLGDGAPGWWSSPAKDAALDGVQRRSRSEEARRAVGQRAGGRLHRGAVHPRRQLQQRDRALGEARRLRRDALAVLLEHRAAEVDGVPHPTRLRARRAEVHVALQSAAA